MSRLGKDNRLAPAVLPLCVLLLPAGCEPASSDSKISSQSVEPKPENILVFPPDFHVADETVNAFVRRAMTDCASGDYQKFRLLWSAREDPLPRAEYDQGWQAVQEIRIRALKQVILAADPERGRAEDQIAYGLAADVSLDPDQRAGRKEPKRAVVLMVVSETGSWRLARPPKTMRRWIKKHSAETDKSDIETKNGAPNRYTAP